MLNLDGFYGDATLSITTPTVWVLNHKKFSDKNACLISALQEDF